MSVWLWCAAVLGALLVPLALAAALRPPRDGIVALEAAGADAALALLLVAVGLGQQSFAFVALVLAIMSFAGSAAFVSLLDRLRE